MTESEIRKNVLCQTPDKIRERLINQVEITHSVRPDQLPHIPFAASDIRTEPQDLVALMSIAQSVQLKNPSGLKFQFKMAVNSGPSGSFEVCIKRPKKEI